ncbi:PEPxxWA-CTERM sorting domain-containing protein [Sandarakinorhabdus sp. AAP62]|uniref:PEPxxWA-CTERM sorting domain-containing protein n=1 Tax=Sandarakinorhabdus sp. AAP62 TaxID=1248916 RepID=UPI0002D4B821|nr:PEPxxWA-CTERM sorting domain-containing protein [Sandarakinorhabdus sp. AAP62]
MFRLLTAAAIAALTALPASAALFLSGDSNIINRVATNSGNQNFFRNIVEGNRVLVHTTTRSATISDGVTGLVTHYQSLGYLAEVYSAASVVNPVVLADYDLYIGLAPDDAYTADELAAMSAYLASGGNILLTGENGANFASLNALLNDALIGLGSSMRLVGDTLDAGFNAAQLQGPSPFLLGTEQFEYAFTSSVTGGLGLFGTAGTNATFLAVEGAGGAVPEPASWAMLIAGFGLVGAVRRRQRVAAA